MPNTRTRSAAHAHDGSDGSGTLPHTGLTGQTTDDHHAKSHAHDGADGSGTAAHADTTGQTANDHHNQSHTDTDHSDGPNAKAGQGVIASLTDNTLGTANDTLAAVPDPADAPITADSLRDDLVANVLPAIRDALADLAAKQNAVLTALRNSALLDT